MAQQSTSHIVMVSPDHFGFNPQTAETNPFMHTPESLHEKAQEVTKKALSEFEHFVSTLKKHHVSVHVMPSRTDTQTPDSVFPNNWFSHHSDGRLVVYPMLTPNRREERQKDALVALLKEHNLPVVEIIDLSNDEKKGHILEGTGSLVLDRVKKVAFAIASSRTTEKEFAKWCKLMGYEGVYITPKKNHSNEVYHTNLFFSLGADFAVMCLDVLETKEEKEQVKDILADLGKELIPITLSQVYSFCGNILEVQSRDGERKIVMSETAYHAFSSKELMSLYRHGKLIVVPIPTIEEIGGGGVRCMMAEVFA